MRFLVLLAALSPLDGAASTGSEDHWPTWRGSDGTGCAGGNPPVEWSEEHNIRWKVRIPGHSSSTPIVYGEMVYVLTAEQTDEKVEREPPAEPEEDSGRGRGRGRGRGTLPEHVHAFTVIALSREDGSVLWEETARRELPHEGTHATSSFASASALTDGKVLLAHFGSRGLFAHDLEGNRLWEVDLGDMQTRNSFGEGASPALHGDTVVVNWDHEGESFLVALDKKTGEERWRTERDERTTWGTPLVVEKDGKAQVIVNGTTVRSYDFKTGKELWFVGGMTSNPIPTPIHVDGMVYVTTGYRGYAMKAIRLARASGDLSKGDAIEWSYDRDTPYVSTPLYHEGRLYFMKSTDGILSVVDAKTGEAVFGPERLELGNTYASPVAAGGRIYITDLEGTTVVLEAGEELTELARNTISEGCQGSFAVAGDEIYVRGNEHLYCIAEG